MSSPLTFEIMVKAIEWKLHAADVGHSIRSVGCSGRDLLPAFVRGRRSEGIAIVGLSRGASAALSAASQADGIWAMVTDGAFVSRWVTTANIRRFMPQFVRLAPVLTRLPWCVHVIYGSVVHDLVARQVKHPAAMSHATFDACVCLC
jgi:hypothetical protein